LLEGLAKMAHSGSVAPDRISAAYMLHRPHQVCYRRQESPTNCHGHASCYRLHRGLSGYHRKAPQQDSAAEYEE